MINLGPYTDFIVASYSAAAIIVASVIVWVLVDYRQQKRILADLEQRGVMRRSAARSGDAP
jgi:heme exporter protein D